MQVWRGKEKAFKTLSGDAAKSYEKISMYLYILETTYREIF